MPIDVETATAIALEYGLGLPDLRALVLLSDDESGARELAARFSPILTSDAPGVGSVKG